MRIANPPERSTRTASRTLTPRLDPSWRQALSRPLVLLLLALLAAQLAAALIAGDHGRAGAGPAGAPLVPLAPDEITALEITGAEGEVRLERRNGVWLLPGLEGFPADGDKLAALLDALTAADRRLPIATSAAARARLGVADDAYRRRLVLHGRAGTQATLLTGESPGFRRLYVRVAGEDSVYDLPLADHQVSARRDDWIARDRLQFDPEAIERVRVEGEDGRWTLLKDGQGWRIAGEERAPDPQAVTALTRALAQLRYDGVRPAAETSAQMPEAGTGAVQRSAEPLLTIEIGLSGGKQRRWRIAEAEGEGFLLATDRDAVRYHLSPYALDAVIGVDIETLLGAEDSAGTEAPGAEDPAAGAEEIPTQAPAANTETEEPETLETHADRTRHDPRAAADAAIDARAGVGAGSHDRSEPTAAAAGRPDPPAEHATGPAEPRRAAASAATDEAATPDQPDPTQAASAESDATAAGDTAPDAGGEPAPPAGDADLPPGETAASGDRPQAADPEPAEQRPATRRAQPYPHYAPPQRPPWPPAPPPNWRDGEQWR